MLYEKANPEQREKMGSSWKRKGNKKKLTRKQAKVGGQAGTRKKKNTIMIRKGKKYTAVCRGGEGGGSPGNTAEGGRATTKKMRPLKTGNSGNRGASSQGKMK